MKTMNKTYKCKYCRKPFTRGIIAPHTRNCAKKPLVNSNYPVPSGTPIAFVKEPGPFNESLPTHTFTNGSMPTPVLVHCPCCGANLKELFLALANGTHQ